MRVTRASLVQRVPLNLVNEGYLHCFHVEMFGWPTTNSED